MEEISSDCYIVIIVYTTVYCIQSDETFLRLPVIKEEFVQPPSQVDSLLHPGDLAMVHREDWEGLHT